MSSPHATLAATCPTCGTTEVTGRFCPQCGTPMPTAPAPMPATPAGVRGPTGPGPGPGRPRWLPAALIGGTVLVLGAIVAVVLLALGGNPSASKAKSAAPTQALSDVTLAAQSVYEPHQSQGFVALLPAGWTTARTKLTMPFQNAVVVKSAQDATTSLTVGVLTSSQGSLASAARRLTPSLGTDAQVQASSQTRFAGKRPAWRITYTAAGLSHVAYLYDACAQRYVVIGASSSSDFANVKPRFGLVASTLQPIC